MIRRLRRAQEGIHFLDILLDETICEGKILVPEELVRDAGGINEKLQAKQKYELLLRIAQQSPIVLEEISGKESSDGYVILGADEADCSAEQGCVTDCYVIGKYSGELKAAGCFDMAIMGVLAQAQKQGCKERIVPYLENMVAHGEDYYVLDEETEPILIYKGDAVCHNVLTVFAEQFGAALERAGEHVIYYDLNDEDVEGILKFTGRHFKAVIGVQSYLFSVKMADEVHYVHEYIYGPKYNFIFDHPVWLQKHLQHHYPDFYILTLDQNYADFARRYFGKEALLFPPAGMEAETAEVPERQYGLTFVGTMGDYFSQVLWIHGLERPKRFLANRFLLIMRQQPDLTLEQAFARAVEHQGLKLTDQEFLNHLRELCVTGYCVMHYYRARVVETILKSGIRLDVFGNSWKLSPLCRYPNLICHPDVTVEESLTIYKQSRMSLNVMSWHKGGFTERMADIMLAGAVLVTDDTTYLRGRYDYGDMLIYHLDNMDQLPEQIAALLADEERRLQMAEHGREKTAREHTWDGRAVQFLQILRERR